VEDVFREGGVLIEFGGDRDDLFGCKIPGHFLEHQLLGVQREGDTRSSFHRWRCHHVKNLQNKLIKSSLD
jgi:hypothetical protein